MFNNDDLLREYAFERAREIARSDSKAEKDKQKARRQLYMKIVEGLILLSGIVYLYVFLSPFI